ncbi:MAG: hypothetical protein MnENMB40S_08040 [Rhizobiaceae bacterium MnEN-MB40S]|nr:MAG: hypothetical protein MnENMB40S_08040 [Rhizobiaceae bacterium MnEN-MB40S]
MNPTDKHAASTEHMVDYDRHSHMQDWAVLSKSALIANLVEQIGTVTPEFVLTDYGCGPGHSAIDAVTPAIEAYRKLDETAPMVIRHGDQPGNDWNSLLALIYGADGYRKKFSDIRTELAIDTFYLPMAAPGSVALATSFAASHWLSHAIAPWSAGAVWFSDMEGVARREMAALARSDWQRFLRLRAEELRPGGFLLVSTLGSIEDADEINGVKASSRRLYRAIQTVAQQMVDDGLLLQSALDHFAFPVWFPTEREAREPIETETDLADAFEIVSCGVEPASVNPEDVYVNEIGDPEAYGRLYAGYVRAFGESSLRLHLFARSTPDPAEVDRLNEEFFNRFARLYKEAPGAHAAETWIMTMVLRRR